MRYFYIKKGKQYLHIKQYVYKCYQEFLLMLHTLQANTDIDVSFN
ncbi:hypothetical protein F990_03014 [Acinetobacter tjernbergiae DSM 14971 = CIP 107465]|uniref:Uncharacterized protein n=1 Tax=Acinetobacter tjernbergiae DSM 14971 = CIP 107465 TaxID=1120928 RepID=V2UZ76_9GAMM|nr:hypothetical protein F990_03014 [Acinetobacter tjernbergiae DSM 14971 = CIP 107465]